MGSDAGPRAKTHQEALRRRQEHEGPTAETPQGVVVNDRSLLSRCPPLSFIETSWVQSVQNRSVGGLVSHGGTNRN